MTYKDNVTASGLDDIVRAVKQVMVVEDSKWREAVTAQTNMTKKYLGARVEEMSSHANALQLDFKASIRFSTPIYYRTVPGFGDHGYADSFSMFVCVYWAGSVIFVGTLPVWFLTWVCSGRSLEVQFK